MVALGDRLDSNLVYFFLVILQGCYLCFCFCYFNVNLCLCFSTCEINKWNEKWKCSQLPVEYYTAVINQTQGSHLNSLGEVKAITVIRAHVRCTNTPRYTNTCRTGRQVIDLSYPRLPSHSSNQGDTKQEKERRLPDDTDIVSWINDLQATVLCNRSNDKIIINNYKGLTVCSAVFNAC